MFDTLPVLPAKITVKQTIPTRLFIGWQVLNNKPALNGVLTQLIHIYKLAATTGNGMQIL